ncbi:hypothetical protein ACFWZE_004333 [Salmonella enterica]
MATREQTIARDWQQITDGTQTVIIQFNGSLEFCDSQQKPPDETASLKFRTTFCYQNVTIAPPTVCWVRAMDKDVILTIL